MWGQTPQPRVDVTTAGSLRVRSGQALHFADNAFAMICFGREFTLSKMFYKKGDFASAIAELRSVLQLDSQV